MKLQAVDKETGKVVEPGTVLNNGDILKYASRPTIPGKNGKVIVEGGTNGLEYYAGNYGLRVDFVED